jgi:hypothetical protein
LVVSVDSIYSSLCPLFSSSRAVKGFGKPGEGTPLGERCYTPAWEEVVVETSTQSRPSWPVGGFCSRDSEARGQSDVGVGGGKTLGLCSSFEGPSDRQEFLCDVSMARIRHGRVCENQRLGGGEDVSKS